MNDDSGPPERGAREAATVSPEALPEGAYREIFDATAEALIVYDVAGHVLVANEGTRAMFRATDEQLRNASIGDLSVDLPPYTAAEARGHFERARREGIATFEWHCRRTNGETFWSEVSLRRFELDGQQHLMACVRDVDERKSLQDTMRASEERFATIFNRSSTMMAFSDPRSGQIVDVNEAWLRATSLRRFEAIGKTARELGLWPRAADEDKVLEDLRVNGRVRDLEVEMRLGGRTAAVQVSVEWVDLRDDRYILWELRDVSERRRAEREQEHLRAQLQQAQKMESIGQLAGGIAHDFNNILSVILSFTSLVAGDLHESDPRRADLEQVLHAAERASQLTRQLLAFSRKQPISPRVLDPIEVLRGMHPMLRRLIGEDVEIAFVLPAHVGRIRADVAQLEQAVMNLAVNARDAMPDGGKLTIEAADVDVDASYRDRHLDLAEGPYVMIAVSDTGSGMDEATRARAFEPFFTTKGAGRGTGLGLSTVFGIVKQSGGAIWLYSEVGRGTTFKMFFPRAACGDAPAEDPPRALRHTTRDATVLVVEDEPALRELVTMVLRRAGYAVLEAAHPLTAIEVARAHPGAIDVLLTDVVMPHMNGKQLADALTADRPGLKVLYVSGYTENTIVHHGVVDEGVHFLAKPLTPDRLLGALDRVVGS